MRARRPLRTRTRVNPVNRERKATLSQKQYGSDAFVRWIHGLACIIPGCDAREIEQAHVVSRAAGGTWEDVVPMCRDHHRAQHALGILTFEQTCGVDLIALAREVQRAWRQRESYERVLREGR